MADEKKVALRYFIQGPRGFLPSEGKAERMASDFGATRSLEPSAFGTADPLAVALVVVPGFDRLILVDSPEVLAEVKKGRVQSWWRMSREHERFAK